MTSAGKRDREQLTLPAKPVGLLRRLRSDPSARRLFISSLIAALAGTYIALG